MAGRGPMPTPYARHLLGPGIGRPLVNHPLDMLPPTDVLEHRLTTQNAEIKRLASENQRLAATHVALREELALAQREVQRLHSHTISLKIKEELQLGSLLENNANMEAGLQAAESIKADLQQARADTQNLILLRQDLTAQVQKLTQELQRAHAEVWQIPAMHTEIEGLRQELQRARTAFGYEKAANSEKKEQMHAMEKNLVSMGQEVEKLHVEIESVSDKRGHAMPYGDVYDGTDASYPSAGQTMYRDVYGMSKMPVAPESVAPYATGGGPSWGGYDVPHGSSSHVYR